MANFVNIDVSKMCGEYFIYYNTCSKKQLIRGGLIVDRESLLKEINRISQIYSRYRINIEPQDLVESEIKKELEDILLNHRAFSNPLQKQSKTDEEQQKPGN